MNNRHGNLITTSLLKRVATGFVIAAVAIFLFFACPPYVLSAALITILVWILWREWPRFKAPLLTPLYPVVPFVYMIALNQSDERALLAYVAVIAACYDSGAYAIGKMFGTHKLCPTISPHKTVEGFVGGIIGALIIGYMFNPLLSATTILRLAFTLALAIGAAGGDLFESLLKRRSQLKDAGSLLPGHGGFMDRFDSLLLIVPVVYLFKNMLIGLL